MQKEMTKVELSLEQVSQVWGLWDEVGKVGRRRKIAEKTGLPLATVRAVFFGQYEVRNGVAIVRVPIADHRSEIEAQSTLKAEHSKVDHTVVAGRVRSTSA